MDREFLLARLRLMISTPALRARHLDNQYALQQAIVDALGGEAADPDVAFDVAAAASACLAAMHIALVRWAEDDGRTSLAALITKALAAAFGDDVVDVPDVYEGAAKTSRPSRAGLGQDQSGDLRARA